MRCQSLRGGGGGGCVGGGLVVELVCGLVVAVAGWGSVPPQGSGRARVCVRGKGKSRGKSRPLTLDNLVV